MAKWIKRILGIAAVGGALAGIIYYFKKSGSDTEEDFSEDFEDEDFDLDSDLKPASDREYVSLTPKNEEKEDSGSVTAEENGEPEDNDKSKSTDESEAQQI